MAGEVIAGISAIAVVVVGWALKRFDQRNTEQHAENLGVLREIRSDVKDVSKRLNEHIDWHLKEDVR